MTEKTEKKNLEQKFVALRRSIPAISQKKYTENVKYKYLKIYDVFEHLTPAMNREGVNFDVVAETASRHYENGDPMFYTSFLQTTRTGERTVWVYEADLTVAWVNADDPADRQEVTLHALGTNDGGPDKAKGSAWTYCLKYYLFEKFQIDQGDDDPDNTDLSGIASGFQQAPPVQQAAPRKLSDAQIKRLHAKALNAGITIEVCDARIRGRFSCEPNEMTRDQYEEVCAALDKAAAERDKEVPFDVE